MKFCTYFFALVVIYFSYSPALSGQAMFNQDPDNPNLDFSLGNFSRWELSWGTLSNSELHAGPEGPSSHIVVERAGSNWDANAGIGNLPKVPEGLDQVARLGHPAGHGYGDPASYKMKYKISINPEYPILFFQIASLMDVNHLKAQNSHYKFALKTLSGDDIPEQPCTGLELYPTSSGVTVSSSNPPLEYPLTANFNNTYHYQTWESVAIDVGSYAGDTLVLEFVHTDCWKGYHGSYSYISAGMRQLYDTVYFCRGEKDLVIKPYLPHFKSYSWSTGSASDSAVVPDPAEGDTISCTVASYNGCETVFHYVLKEVVTEADFSQSAGLVCHEIRFVDESVSNHAEIISWRWSFGDPFSGERNTDTAQHPSHIYPGPGTYTVTLTVTDDRGCTSSIRQDISVSPEGTSADISVPTPVCLGEVVHLEDMTPDATARRWFINHTPLEDTSRRLPHRFTDTGDYDIVLVVTGPDGCPDTAVQAVHIRPLPLSSIQVLPYTLSAPVTDPRFHFIGFEDHAEHYEWQMGDDTPSGRYVSYTYPAEIADHTVYLRTYDDIGCYDTSSVIVSIMPPDFTLPTAFTPNGDGLNDVFEIINVTHQDIMDVSIYNRFGERVFYGHGAYIGWNGTFGGKACDAGVYHYVIRYRLPDSGREHVFRGEVTLLR